MGPIINAQFCILWAPSLCAALLHPCLATLSFKHLMIRRVGDLFELPWYLLKAMYNFGSQILSLLNACESISLSIPTLNLLVITHMILYVRHCCLATRFLSSTCKMPFTFREWSFNKCVMILWFWWW